MHSRRKYALTVRDSLCDCKGASAPKTFYAITLAANRYLEQPQPSYIQEIGVHQVAVSKHECKKFLWVGIVNIWLTYNTIMKNEHAD